MGYNSDSASDRLSAVRDAIARCLTSQDYTIAGRRQVMAQLRDLRQMEKELQQEVSQSLDGESMASVAQIFPAN